MNANTGAVGCTGVGGNACNSVGNSGDGVRDQSTLGVGDSDSSGGADVAVCSASASARCSDVEVGESVSKTGTSSVSSLTVWGMTGTTLGTSSASLSALLVGSGTFMNATGMGRFDEDALG